MLIVSPKHAFSSMDSDGIRYHPFRLEKSICPFFQGSQFQERYPLILGPVSTLQPFEVGYDVSGVENVANITRSLRLTQAVNLLGLPSVALPVAVSGGLPQAVQIIGPRYREDLCLDAAEAIERDVGTFTPIDPRN